MTEMTPVSVAVENRSSQPPVEPISERQMIQPVIDVPRMAPRTMDTADDHNGRCRRRLNHSRHTGAQQKALERIAGQAVKNQFQLIAGDLLEPIAHQSHTEQEQGNAAEQRNHVGYTHILHPLFVLI